MEEQLSGSEKLLKEIVEKIKSMSDSANKRKLQEAMEKAFGKKDSEQDILHNYIRTLIEAGKAFGNKVPAIDLASATLMMEITRYECKKGYVSEEKLAILESTYKLLKMSLEMKQDLTEK